MNVQLFMDIKELAEGAAGMRGEAARAHLEAIEKLCLFLPPKEAARPAVLPTQDTPSKGGR